MECKLIFFSCFSQHIAAPKCFSLSLFYAPIFTHMSRSNIKKVKTHGGVRTLVPAKWDLLKLIFNLCWEVNSIYSWNISSLPRTCVCLHATILALKAQNLLFFTPTVFLEISRLTETSGIITKFNSKIIKSVKYCLHAQVLKRKFLMSQNCLKKISSMWHYFLSIAKITISWFIWCKNNLVVHKFLRNSYHFLLSISSKIVFHFLSIE